MALEILVLEDNAERGMAMLERLQIAERMVCNGAQAEIDAAWQSEIERRIDKHEAGKGESYPVLEVIAELRELLNEADCEGRMNS